MIAGWEGAYKMDSRNIGGERLTQVVRLVLKHYISKIQLNHFINHNVLNKNL